MKSVGNSNKEMMISNRLYIIYIVLIAASIVMLWNRGQANLFLNLADEGYLWYGTWRTSLGEIPNRDFQAYLPGRYYWGAFWGNFFGRGLIGIRVSCALFQFITLVLGLLAVHRLKAPWWFLAVSGFIFTIWVFPRYKTFDAGIAMAGAYFAVLIMENPTVKRHFIAGIFVGITACFGLHHGLYGVTGFSMVIALTWLTMSHSNLFKRVSGWLGGVMAGFLPVLFMWITIPGYFASFLERILTFFRLKSTNLFLPIPWPWAVWGSMHPREGVFAIITSARFVEGVILLLWLALLVFAAACFFVKKDNNDYRHAAIVLTGAALLSIPRLHHFLSRADLEHLANAIHPTLIGLLAAPFLFNRKHQIKACVITLSCLLVLSYPVLRSSPFFRKMTAAKGSLVAEKIGNDTIRISRYIAKFINFLRMLKAEFMLPGETILTIPNYPAFYPLLNQRSPIHDIYPLLEATNEKQREMITDMEKGNVNWIFIDDLPLGGDNDRRFSNTHKIVWGYMNDNFEPIYFKGLPRGFAVLRRKTDDNRKKAEYYHKMAIFDAKRSRFHEAFSKFDEALKLDPNNIELYNSIGAAYYHKGDREKAIENFKKALNIDPVNKKARSNLKFLLK